MCCAKKQDAAKRVAEQKENAQRRSSFIEAKIKAMAAFFQIVLNVGLYLYRTLKKKVNLCMITNYLVTNLPLAHIGSILKLMDPPLRRYPSTAWLRSRSSSKLCLVS